MNNAAGHLSETASSTSVSLLRRLRDRDQQAWVRLTRIYGPLVYRWCRRSRVHAGEIADIAQDVFKPSRPASTGFGVTGLVIRFEAGYGPSRKTK